MSGSKKQKAVAQPATPTLPNVPPAGPTPGPMPGQLELISQQLAQGFPSMPQSATLPYMQNIYKPVTGPDPATLLAVQQATGGGGSANQGSRGLAGLGGGGSGGGSGGGYQGGMINTPSELLRLIMQARGG